MENQEQRRLLPYCPGCGIEPADVAELCRDCNACGDCAYSPEGFRGERCAGCAEEAR